MNSALDVNQYGHTAWTIRVGFFNSRVIAIAQTPDGYLWLEFTTDGVLTIDPALLRELPEIESAMLVARFRRGNE